MQRRRWTLILAKACACWNWKCALLSAAARSLVYLAAMARSGSHNRLGLVAVEMAYVTLTAGIYAGMQQRALGLRSRRLGNLVIAVGVPGLAQLLDWLTHRAIGPAAPSKAIFAVCVFTLISALFHLHVMRRGRISYRSRRTPAWRRFPPYAPAHSRFRPTSRCPSLEPQRSSRASSPIRRRVVTLALLSA